MNVVRSSSAATAYRDLCFRSDLHILRPRFARRLGFALPVDRPSRFVFALTAAFTCTAGTTRVDAAAIGTVVRVATSGTTTVDLDPLAPPRDAPAVTAAFTAP